MTLQLVPPSCKVYTPEPLATSIVAALGDDESCEWLEPCAGAGALLAALNAQGVDPGRIRALDLEPHDALDARLARMLFGRDFIEWASATTERFDRIVANPPYVAISRLSYALRMKAVGATYPGGGNVPASANYWCAFLCAALSVLKAGGSLAFILPAAWDYADYATPLRTRLPAEFENFSTYRSRRPLFDEVQEGSVVIVGHGFKRTHRTTHRREHFTSGALVDALLQHRTGNTLAPVFAQPTMPSTTGATKRVREIMQIRIGGVTGDARYFVLTEAQRLEHSLPAAALRPVLTRARHLLSAEMTKVEWDALRAKGERVWLFCPTKAACRNSAVKKYLKLRPEEGGCHRDRLKVQIRKPWFRTPLPSRCDGFLSGMGRLGPWMALSEMRTLSAINTLYVISFSHGIKEREKFGWALSFLSSMARRQLRERCRHYADGLPKYEPGDLAEIELPQPVKFTKARSTYRAAVELLLDGRPNEASDMADRWIADVAK